eukprot:TRINITY_DN65925_c0_g1_i1.p1 TRINITY_DN65925_c0_g1~~TRINITY_DN65925_c0_g1_i1.p1  ORF type:complete len:230 (+),score=20.07 TRINITY_DN65925_c0_g1_i1:49-738(+)
MATSFGERFAALISFAACFDACICVFLPDGAHGRAMKVIVLTAAVAKALLAVMSLKMKFKLCSTMFLMRSPRRQAIAYSSWFGFSATMSIALVASANRRLASDPLHLMFVCLRMVELSMFVGVIVYASRQEERICAMFQNRVCRLCTLDDIKNFLSSRNVDLSKLSCCVCLEEFRPHDTIAVHHCNHVAHTVCEHKLILQRRLGTLECPMMCNFGRRHERSLARRMGAV